MREKQLAATLNQNKDVQFLNRVKDFSYHIFVISHSNKFFKGTKFKLPAKQCNYQHQ